MLPPYDLKTPGWKAATAGALAARREELAVALDDAALFTEAEAIAAFGLERGECRRGCDHGVIPGPDRGPFWSRAAAEVLATRAEKLREGLRPPPCMITDRAVVYGTVALTPQGQFLREPGDPNLARDHGQGFRIAEPAGDYFPPVRDCQ